MRKIIAILFIALPHWIFAQTTLTYVRSNSKADKILVLPPVAIISAISNGSHQRIDSTLTQQVSRYTLSQLQNSFPDSVQTMFFLPDSVVSSKLTNFIIKLNNKFKNERQISKYELPDSIQTLFDTSKARYVFCTLNLGFKRTRDNYVNTHLAMDVTNLLFGTGLVPLESAAAMSGFTIDLENKNIVYFERELWGERDPTDNKIIRIELNRIISHYFL